MKIERPNIMNELARGRKIYIGMVLQNKKVRYIHCEGEGALFETEKILLEYYNTEPSVKKLLEFKHIVILPKNTDMLPLFVYDGVDRFNTYDISVTDFMGLDNALWGGEPRHNAKFLWLDGDWYYSYEMGNIHLLKQPNVFYTLGAFIKQKCL